MNQDIKIIEGPVTIGSAEIEPNHWAGPHEVLVPNSIKSVVARDGYNTMYKNGMETEKKCYNHISPEAYREKYATLDKKTGKWYYGKTEKESFDDSCVVHNMETDTESDDDIKSPADFWTGPYGVLVPNKFSEVVARDGYNTMSKNGSETERWCTNPGPISAEIYREKYAALDEASGQWYYCGAKKKLDDFLKKIDDKCNNEKPKQTVDLGYWNGPYGVLVPNEIGCVVASDGYNNMVKDGSCTEMGCLNPNPISAKIYQNKYATFDEASGKWFHDRNEKWINTNYWKGPYGILVPNEIGSVVASDGYNTMYPGGSETEKFCRNPDPMSAEIYRNKYAVYDSACGKWFYIKNKPKAEKKLITPTVSRSIPEEESSTRFKMVLDADLINGSKHFVREILWMERMNRTNYQKLAAFDAKDFNSAVTNYGCDCCETHCNERNPIYTNSKKQGTDICTKCITKAFETIKPMPDSTSEPVYSLREICKLNGKIV